MLEDEVRHILIVEDEESHMNLFERNIRRIRDIRIDLKQAVNGKEGVAQIEAHFATPDAPRLLVLLDLNLPVINGFEVMAYIQPKPYRDQILMAILTTSDESEDMRRAYNLGYDHYLVKPVHHDQLRGIIENL